MKDNEDFFRARDEYNRGRKMRGRGKHRPHRSRRDREYTRKQQIEAVEAAMKAFSKAFLEEQPDGDVVIEEFLQEEFSAPITDGVSAWDFWKAVEAGDARFMVKNANVLYVKALAYIAAMFLWLKGRDKSSFQGHLTALVAKSGMKVIGNEKQLLAAIHKVSIWQRRDTKQDKRKASATVSRDIRAILWLLSQGQSPSEFVAYQEGRGGGVDEWYLNYRREHPASSRRSGRHNADDDTMFNASSESVSDELDSSDVDGGGDDAGGDGDSSVDREGGAGKANGHRRARASQDGLLKASKAKAEECNCVTPNHCASRDAVHRFQLEKRRYLVMVYEGDDSYAGATPIAAVKLSVPGPRLMRRVRLERLLASVLERGQSFEL